MQTGLDQSRSGWMSDAEFRAFQARRPDHERWELLGGVAMMMAPPTIAHSQIASSGAPVRAMHGPVISNAAPRLAGSARHDPLVQSLINDPDRAVDLGVGHAELMRDQLDQQVDPLDERGAIGDRAGCR